MIKTQGSEERRSILRRSGFWTAAAAITVLICIATLLVWSANDASFTFAAWKAKVVLRIEHVRAADPQIADDLGITDAIRSLHWNGLGKRVLTLITLCGLGASSTLALLVLSVRRVTARRTVAFFGVLLAWIGFFTTRTAVDEWRTRRQVLSILPRFEQAAATLTDEWPSESGEIPPGVRFLVSAERYPDVLVVRAHRDPYPFHEDFGLRITRGRDGIIRFDLAGAADSSVEYHPNGTQPSSYKSGFGRSSPPVAWVSELKDRWYLVRYGGS